jgi:hypothetical protein
VTSHEKLVDVEKFYDRDPFRPVYEKLESKPLFIMTSD